MPAPPVAPRRRLRTFITAQLAVAFCTVAALPAPAAAAMAEPRPGGSGHQRLINAVSQQFAEHPDDLTQVLTAADLEGSDMEGAKYVCSPPPRDAESQAAIWEGLQQGVFQTFSSDHCPFRYDDPQGKLNPRARSSFRWVPNGCPGIETRLPILFSEGVSAGRISLNRFVELTATNHAKIYGLYPRKGSVGIGFDADEMFRGSPAGPSRTEV